MRRTSASPRAVAGRRVDQYARVSSIRRLFPQAGLADQRDHLSASLEYLVDRAADRPHLAVAPDQWSGARRSRRFGSRLPSEHAVRGDRLRLALDLHDPTRLDVEDGAHETKGVGGDLHRAGLCRLLHARRDVHGVAHRRVLDTKVRAHLADDDGTRVDANANVQIQIAIGPGLLPIRTDRLDHLQPRRDGALGVVLVRDRSTEEGEDGVTHQPSHRALVAIDRSDQVLEHLVHDLGPLFGIEPFGHGRRTDHVAEQHRHDAAFALHRPTIASSFRRADAGMR
jgi:hypothetical protein